MMAQIEHLVKGLGDTARVVVLLLLLHLQQGRLLLRVFELLLGVLKVAVPARLARGVLRLLVLAGGEVVRTAI